MSQGIKLRHNIIQFPELGLNYWAIPKCMNTAIKYTLLSEVGATDEEPEGVASWVHNIEMDRYITPDQALSNGGKNFSVIRSPIERVRSLYRSYGTGRRGAPSMSPSAFIQKHIKGDDRCNVHFRSFCYFLPDVAEIEVLKMEQDDVAEFLGLEVPRVNDGHGIAVELSDALKFRIRQRYAADFERFGY